MTVDYEKFLVRGFSERLKDVAGEDEYGKQIQLVAEGLKILIDRIITALKASSHPEKEKRIAEFKNMLNGPALGFEEALQRTMFFNQIMWQTRHRLNGFGHMAVLKRFGLMETYTKLFEKPMYTLGKMIVKNPEVAKFLWGEGNYLPNIDNMNNVVKNDEFSYQICPIRFSIGAILFKRELWDNMGYFKVTKEIDLGIDEKQICECCITFGRAIIVSNNTIVGHLSFGQQNASMKEYFMNHKDVFDIKN